MPGHWANALIADVPHVKQRPDFCGEACTEMWLRKLGHRMDQNDVFERSGLDPALGRGAYTAELKVALEHIGFRVGDVWYVVDPRDANKQMNNLWNALHADLVRGVPSIVCTRFDESPSASEHFRLAVGYDPASDELIYHDPAVDHGGYLRMRRQRFLSLWPLRYRANAWSVIRLRLEPGTITDRAVSGLRKADYAQEVIKVRRLVKSEPFTVLVEPPFVVVGDDAPEQVAARARGVVRWTVEKLKKDYFSRDPNKILTVWLFRNAESYEHHADLFFHDTPTTRFGYYSSKHGALIMNISTGGGTLVHEIVHPFMEANFPDVPPWFNEGMGSLYEQSEEKEGRIHGMPNWRLPALQTAIRRQAVPSFEHLMKLDSAEFYGEGSGLHYAQARYLCYYLQEAGLLTRFYHSFVSNAASDPDGIATLKQVLGETDLEQFKRKWQSFVLGLRFGG